MESRDRWLTAGFAVVVIMLAIGLLPGGGPGYTEPTVLESVFGSRLMIWMARLLLVSAAFVLVVGGVFIVSSAAVRMSNGDWLRRVGPLEVSEVNLQEVETQLEFWRTAARESAAKIDELEAELRAVDGLARTSYEKGHS